MKRVVKRVLRTLPDSMQTAIRGTYSSISNARSLSVRGVINKASKAAGLSKLTWKLNLPEEVSFWDRYFETKGLEWPEDFQHRLNPETELQEYVAELIDAPPGSEVTILDVGAGPITGLGKMWGGRELKITAVDPLAHEYSQLLVKYNLKPVVQTKFARAENLLGFFQPDSFDLVHASNCIDHSFDPHEAFRQMVAVVKPNHFVIMVHKVNEGETEDYQGLHQWNFYEENGEFLVSSHLGKSVNVTQKLSKVAEVTCHVATWSDENLIFVKMRKKPLP